MTTVSALALAGLLLTGCSAGAQTKAQACKSIEGDITSATTDLQTAFSKIQTDPSAAEAGLKKFDSKMKSATAKVSNPTVKSAATATVKALDKMDVDLKAYIKDPSSTTALQASANKVQTTFSKLGTTCSS